MKHNKLIIIGIIFVMVWLVGLTAYDLNRDFDTTKVQSDIEIIRGNQEKVEYLLENQKQAVPDTVVINVNTKFSL